MLSFSLNHIVHGFIAFSQEYDYAVNHLRECEPEEELLTLSGTEQPQTESEKPQGADISRAA